LASVGIVAEMTVVDVEYPESFRGNYCTSTFVVDNSYQLRSHDSLAMSTIVPIGLRPVLVVSSG
jgi:hypothetical protein